MSTAMITALFTGFVCTACMLLTLCILANYKSFLLFFITNLKKQKESPFLNPYRSSALFSITFYDAEENSVCNPYRFRNVLELSAHVLSFNFFIQPVNYQSSMLRRKVTAREYVYTEIALQKPTTCL